jgi:hypothetical protein
MASYAVDVVSILSASCLKPETDRVIAAHIKLIHVTQTIYTGNSLFIYSFFLFFKVSLNQWFPNFFGPPPSWFHKLIPSAPYPTL